MLRNPNAQDFPVKQAKQILYI